MAVTALCKSVIIDNISATDDDIEDLLDGVTVTHIYGVSVIPISNTQSRVIAFYD